MPAEIDWDAAHRTWLRDQLDHATARLDAVPTGEPTYGRHDRSIGAPVHTPDGERWLRVTSELPWWIEQPMWTGNLDAQAIPNVPMPRILTHLEWTADQRIVRAELRERAPDRVVCDDMVIRGPVSVSADWWAALRRALDETARFRTSRVCVHPQELRIDLLAAFGVDIQPAELQLTTAHGDLHWSNVTAPTLSIMDWETWGTAPAGYDAATLFCASILCPDTARQVHAHLADLLDTPSGLIAQLAAAARLLRLVSDGTDLDLAQPLHAHARTVIDRL